MTELHGRTNCLFGDGSGPASNAEKEERVRVGQILRAVLSLWRKGKISMEEISVPADKARSKIGSSGHLRSATHHRAHMASSHSTWGNVMTGK